MRHTRNQSGFSVIALALVVLVIGVLGFAGYTVYNRQNNEPSSSNTNPVSQPPAVSDAQTPPEVNSTSDLDKALTVLDQTDTSSSSDSAQLDSQLQSF